ncbi:uncharacterized protein TNCV_1295231 [Trichonephila clavipes]|nr:uncharacterized protein TNCV_1295231 [Trichonephila clavipes]
MLGRRIAARPRPPATVRDLEIALLEEWNSIPQSLIDNLIASMANSPRILQISYPSKLFGHGVLTDWAATTIDDVCHKFQATWNEMSVFVIIAQIHLILNRFTCRNCGGGDRGRVAIYRPFGEVSLSLNRTVTCMVLKANDRRTSCPCHDEFRGPRSDFVRQQWSRDGIASRRPTSGRPRGTTERDDRRSRLWRILLCLYLKFELQLYHSDKTNCLKSVTAPSQASCSVNSIDSKSLPFMTPERIGGQIVFSDDNRFYLGANIGRVLSLDMLPWPARSQDLPSIEQSWDTIGQLQHHPRPAPTVPVIKQA